MCSRSVLLLFGLALSFLPLTALPTRAQDGKGLRVIIDDKTGIKIALPLELLTKHELNKWGRTWSSSDNSIKLDLLVLSPKSIKETYENIKSLKGRTVTRSELKDDSFVLEGIDANGTHFHVEALLKGDAVKGFSVVYAMNRKDEFQPLLEKIAQSFEPFPDSAQGKSSPVIDIKPSTSTSSAPSATTAWDRTGIEYTVQGIARGDTLKLHTQPSAASPVAMNLQNTMGYLVSTGRSKRNGDELWLELRSSGKIGWANTRFLRQAAGKLQAPGGISKRSVEKSQPHAPQPADSAKPDASDPVTDCNSDDHDRRLRGCTILIGRADLEIPARAIAYSRRSDTYFRRLDFDHAIADREESLKLEPNETQHKARLAAALHLRGLGHWRRKEDHNAIADFDEAAKLAPQNHEVLEARAVAHAANGEIDKGIDDLLTATKLDASNKIYTQALAGLYERRGLQRLSQSEFGPAASDLSQAIKLTEAKATLHLYRGDAYLKQNNLSPALEDYDKALSLEPGRIDVLQRRGQLHLFGDRFDLAISDFSEAIKKNPKYVQALLFRALALEKADRLDAAATDYRTVLKLEPKNKNAKTNLERLTAFRTWKQKARD